MKTIFSLFFLLIGFSVQAQEFGSLKGRISFKGKPVDLVTVGINELSRGTYSDQSGEFLLSKIPSGTHLISISAIGYISQKKTVQIFTDSTTIITIDLEESFFELDHLVVTGTMKEVSVKDSPIKVQVVSRNALSKTASNNIMDAIQYINGLQQQVDCAVCGTNNIRINGMEGPYTSVLIDGMPVMGALASVYGLNGINPNIIRNIEIIKGPNSTLYGSQAMGGVINIITADPSVEPTLSVQANTSSHGEQNFDFAVVPSLQKTKTMLSGSIYYQDRFIDQNNDNFGDLTNNARISLYNKWEIYRKSGKTFNVAAKYYFEDRLGGTRGFARSMRGSNTVYGESIYTNRLELFSSYELPFKNENFRIDASYSLHDQDSYYGEYRYEADQQTFFTNLIWDKEIGSNGDLITGFSTRHDKLNQLFDGQELPGGSTDIRFVPGIFSQYDHTFSSKLRSLVGIRADHHVDHGIIFSPRMNLKSSPSSHTTLRLNLGTGFRIVNLFTEEHESLTGSREVIVAEELNPERSYNITANWNQIIDIGNSILNADLDLFYTRFTNQIIPDYSNSNQIIYNNLDGYSVSQGIALSIAHNFIAPLTYTVGITFQDVFANENGIKEELLFSANFNAVFGITYTFKKPKLTFDYTSRIVGKMKLPEYPDRNTSSKSFSEHNLKSTKIFSNSFEVFVSVKNIFNYIQAEPIIAADRPFSDDFATDYVYGPLQGRRFLIGVSYKF